jgi:hypothetical protein
MPGPDAGTSNGHDSPNLQLSRLANESAVFSIKWAICVANLVKHPSAKKISFMKIILIWQLFNLTRRIHLRFAKLFLFAGLGIFFQSCVAIRPAEETSTIPGNPLIAGSADLALLRRSAPVLMIGDSLTVGDFGEALQAYLLQRFGSSNVALYGSCGSSPEHWIRSGPEFITKCGYREQTPPGHGTL